MLIIFFFLGLQLDIIHERNDNNNNQHIKVRTTIRNLKNISTSLLHTSKKNLSQNNQHEIRIFSYYQLHICARIQ